MDRNTIKKGIFVLISAAILVLAPWKAQAAPKKECGGLQIQCSGKSGATTADLFVAQPSVACGPKTPLQNQVAKWDVVKFKVSLAGACRSGCVLSSQGKATSSQPSFPLNGTVNGSSVSFGSLKAFDSTTGKPVEANLNAQLVSLPPSAPVRTAPDKSVRLMLHANNQKFKFDCSLSRNK